MANENSEQDVKTTPSELGVRKFTNILQQEDPESWEYINEDPNRPKFAEGATEPTGTGAVPEMQEEPYPQEQVPPDPRLGMAQQGEYDLGRMQRLFPEMFLQTSAWLDPREAARKEAGLSYDSNKRYK